MPANSAKFIFEITDTDYDVSVLDFTAVEKVSTLFGVTLTLVSEEDIPIEEIIGREALLTIFSRQNDNPVVSISTTGDVPDRYFHGIVRKFQRTGTNGRFNVYEAQTVPSFWLLSLRKNCRIFQNKKVQEIIAEVLRLSGIDSDRFEFRLKDDDLKRRFCMQYYETDLHFVSRLLEEEGIFYFFEHSEDKHLLVFCDTEAFYRDIEGSPEVGFNQGGGMVAVQESIQAFSLSRRLKSGLFTHRNYNFKKPSLDLTTNQEGDNELSEQFEVYEYPGAYGETGRGGRLARVRVEALQSLQEQGKGVSNCVRLAPGARFDLTGHDQEEMDGKYFLLEVCHGGVQPGVLGEQAGEDATPDYSNAFGAIPAEVNYRPERRHAKPSIPGIQTARVTGPGGEEIYVDKYGRVKVQFPWDRQGSGDEKTSCWLRVNQFWNGTTWGSQFIPRVGDEVLVAFVNGDMDYPIIIGSAINEAKLPNYELPANKTRSGIRTRSTPKGDIDNYNELRFEDKKGAEEVYLQAEKDCNILVKNNTTETVCVNKAETIGVAKELTIGAGYQVSVGAAMNETVALAKAEEVGLNRMEAVGVDNIIKVGSNYSLDVGDRCTITADTIITLKCGSSTITLEPELITINSPLVKINT